MRVRRVTAIGVAVVLNMLALGVLGVSDALAGTGETTVAVATGPGEMGYNGVAPNEMGYN